MSTRSIPHHLRLSLMRNKSFYSINSNPLYNNSVPLLMSCMEPQALLPSLSQMTIANHCSLYFEIQLLLYLPEALDYILCSLSYNQCCIPLLSLTVAFDFLPSLGSMAKKSLRLLHVILHYRIHPSAH